ncbi:MAG: EAL domain-containing protein [Gemmatimonadota bacterium]
MTIEGVLPGRSGLTAEIARTLLLDGIARDAFHRPPRLAGLALRAPVATLGVVKGDQLLLVSQVGVPAPWSETGRLPLDASFCGLVVETRDVFAVDDAARHPLTMGLPRLDGFPRSAYCGAPLVVQGETVGVLSVCDTRPRCWTADEVALIRDLAASLLRDLERMTGQPEEAEAAPRPATEAVATPRLTTDVVPDGLVMVDSDWKMTFANVRAAEMFGRPERVLRGLNFWEVFPELVGTLLHHECLRTIAAGTPVELEDYCESLGGWVEVRAYRTPEGGAALHLRDVSVRRSEHDELRGREARYHRLFEESRTPLFVMASDSLILEVNHACEDLLGMQREELYRLRLADLAVDRDAFDKLLRDLAEQGAVHDAEFVVRSAGEEEEMLCLLSAAAQPVDHAFAYHGAMRDVTQERRTREELVRSALQDPLTHLPNRIVFMDRLERLLKHSKRRTEDMFAVLFLDLDNFKAVNDTYGHLVGDRLLVAAARRLEACVRQEDTVARLGGDEFGILLDTIQDVSTVTRVVDRIREGLALPFTDEGTHAGCSASIGIALSMSGYENAADLLQDADSAMYQAKSTGRNDYIIFDSDMHERTLALRRLESDLRAAVARDQLNVHYHPVVELAGGSVTGLEALVRWTHPERGILLPSEFMPLAEQTGLIVEIGWWILREACRQLRSWQVEYPDAAFSLTMSVNLSAKQFVHPGLVQKIDEILLETELAPECLRLDMTEAVVMQNAKLATELLRELRSRGIQICLDDFGTGYSSMRQLSEFPISTLKIDRSFINQLGGQSGGREVVQTIIALGRSMAIDAIAEGVETPEQLQQLRELGTKFAQGFLFSLPLDRDAASSLLAEHT